MDSANPLVVPPGRQSVAGRLRDAGLGRSAGGAAVCGRTKGWTEDDAGPPTGLAAQAHSTAHTPTIADSEDISLLTMTLP
jgi:hypothetical protein